MLRKVALSVGLFLLAPYVGEFLLGNQPITAFPSMLLLAPMYGAGALLVREVGRRAAAGWPAMVLLAAAYALTEEGVIDQMLFNPGYLGLDSFAEYAPIPGLGLSMTLTQASLALHTVWSICVPIAIVEAFDREEPRPWLGRVGLTVTAAIFVLGSILLTWMQYEQFQFFASPLQLGVMAVAIAGLIAAASYVGRRPVTVDSRVPAPKPWKAAAAAFGLASFYWLVDTTGPAVAGPWVVVGGCVVVAAGCAYVLVRFSRRVGWGRAHRLAVAGGLLLTYVWLGFVNSASLDVSRATALIGNVVFGAGAIVILVLAGQRSRAG